MYLVICLIQWDLDKIEKVVIVSKIVKRLRADTVATETGKQYHLQLAPGDIPPTVLMPGDPKRVQKIAKLWDSSEKIADYRQYVTYKGVYKGVDIASISSGIGPPACEIAINEMKNIGVEHLIRVGSCGTLSGDVEIGDLIISEAAVRLEDTSKHYVIPEFPAVASRMVTSALIQACEELNLTYHVGITASTSSFYVGQGREAWNKYLPSFRQDLFDDLQKAGVLNFEMEASAVFVLGSLFQMHMGAICAVYANRVTNEFATKGENEAIKASNEAVRILNDYIEDGKRYWY